MVGDTLDPATANQKGSQIQHNLEPAPRFRQMEALHTAYAKFHSRRQCPEGALESANAFRDGLRML